MAAVLPMPRETYRATMERPGRDGFDELLPQASLVIDLELVEGVSEQSLRQSEAHRALQDEALGRFLARYCQAAVALWDGEKGGIGDTASVVEMIHEVGREVFRIVTPREGQPPPRLPAGTIVPPDTADTSEAHVAGSRLEALNRAAGREINRGCPPYGGLLPAAEKIDLPEFERRVAQAFWAADQSSMLFGKSTKATFAKLLVLAFLAVASFEVYAHLFHDRHLLWFLYPVALFAAWVIHRRARKREVEVLYLECRSLAEALRTQFFWSLAGIRRSVADAYLEHHCAELEWIRVALRNVWLYSWQGHNPVLRGIELAREHWVKHQANWFAGVAKKQKKTQDRVETLSELFLWAVFIFSIVAPTYLLLAAPGHETAQNRHGVLILLVTLPSLAVGLLRVWVERQGYAEQARAYHQMAEVFKKRIDGEEKTLEELGVEALEENGDWLLLHRDRPLRVIGST